MKRAPCVSNPPQENGGVLLTTGGQKEGIGPTEAPGELVWGPRDQEMCCIIQDWGREQPGGFRLVLVSAGHGGGGSWSLLVLLSLWLTLSPPESDMVLPVASHDHFFCRPALSLYALLERLSLE